MSDSPTNGTLFVVATPIGNLEDVAPRAARILAEVDLILAEDTRVTRKLCSHLNIHTPLQSFHDHSERERTPSIVAKLQDGQNIALVSDAGTPLLADPGYFLLRAAINAGITVSPVPGPSVVAAALSVAGLPTDAFSFHGFFPRKAKAAESLLATLPGGTCVFFESPRRIVMTLRVVESRAGRRPVVVARELTKVHEEVRRGSARELREHYEAHPPRGEIVLLLGPDPGGPPPEEVTMQAAYEEATARGLSRTEALREVSRRTGKPRREVYRQLFADK